MPVPTTAISCIGWFKGIRHLRNLAALKLLKEKSFYETLKTFGERFRSCEPMIKRWRTLSNTHINRQTQRYTPREINIRTDTKKIIQIGAATRTKIQKEF